MPADKRKAKRDVTPHVLRHTAVTWAMQNRADPEEADGYFGLTAETRRRVYQHHHPDHQKGVAEAVTRSPAAQKPHRYGPSKPERKEAGNRSGGRTPPGKHAGNRRSGRGGRRFESYHSDQIS